METVNGADESQKPPTGHDGPVDENARTARPISLRGVRVHNLKNIDVDIPRHQVVAICGVSGSGKTSLALDTLYAEGQRRFIESFSTTARQHLQRLPQPDVEHIGAIPPAIAVTRSQLENPGRATVGSATETVDDLRVLYARHADIWCSHCGLPVAQHSAESVEIALRCLPSGTRYMVTFPVSWDGNIADAARAWLLDGYARWIVGNGVMALDAMAQEADALPEGRSPDLSSGSGWVVVDRLVVGRTPEARVRDSVDVAMRRASGAAVLFFPEGVPLAPLLGPSDGQASDGQASDGQASDGQASDGQAAMDGTLRRLVLDGKGWQRLSFSASDDCDQCGTRCPGRDPRWYSDASPLGACPSCAGAGRNEDKTTCRACDGTRLGPAARAARLGGRSIDEVARLNIGGVRQWCAEQRQRLGAGDQGGPSLTLLDQMERRLAFLDSIGLHYLTLDRELATLSTGEAQRVLLTRTLGSPLVNMLYVLDEPSVGLHPFDLPALQRAVAGLCDRGNTVVIVEHDAALIQSADHVIELGPGAGEQGGEVRFQGTPTELCASGASLTGEFLTGRRGGLRRLPKTERRLPNRGWLRLQGARGHHLKDVTVELPLGVLCVVSGVSGAGKSTLIEQTLYPALLAQKGKKGPQPLPFEALVGTGQVDDVIFVDQRPLARSSRSNPVTYVKAFDAMRAVFAETSEARLRNISAAQFSFNVSGGRCEACKGEGSVRIDMQFLADVSMVCQDCQGKRYKPSVLDVLFRGQSIADVLDMSVRQAMAFFRGYKKVQQRLQPLIDVGLEYLTLGQASTALSAGEAQRLKLAAHLTTARRGKNLFLIDEPTAGLHASDVLQVLDGFSTLLDRGHSLVVIEHDRQILAAADYIIDLGPGPASAGGRVVAAGTPEEVADCANSLTGQVLARYA